ncbi:hypothetical protein ADK17_24635 [Bacillus anthracis]|nr:hypothetical protein ADK17_24635 [Bacillus anthracis]
MMKKLIEVLVAVSEVFVNGKQVAMELNETPEQPLPKREESSKQIQPLKAILHT